jgi:hypothetical protein
VRMWRARAVLAAAVAGVLAVVAPGCGSTAASPPSTTAVQPECPNSYGGTCRGTLAAGTYRTSTFSPAVTYTVPGGGWVNEEDDPVSFTLAPPGVPRAQVQNATNVIMVWPGVQAAAMSCAVTADGRAPAAAKPLALWIAHHPGVTATRPRPVTVGGLHGYIVSIAIAAHGGIRCGRPFRFVPLLNNLVDTEAQYAVGGPVVSDHALIYLLKTQGATLGIIADSAGRRGASLAADARVIERFGLGGA